MRLTASRVISASLRHARAASCSCYNGWSYPQEPSATTAYVSKSNVYGGTSSVHQLPAISAYLIGSHSIASCSVHWNDSYTGRCMRVCTLRGGLSIPHDARARVRVPGQGRAFCQKLSLRRKNAASAGGISAGTAACEARAEG